MLSNVIYSVRTNGGVYVWVEGECVDGQRTALTWVGLAAGQLQQLLLQRG
jgi:hypothetical protein